MAVVMEQSNSLLLNEEALRLCPDPTKPVFIYEWLRYLHRILPATRKADLKSCQQKLVEQLVSRVATGPGAPTRRLLAKCLAQVFAIADTYDLFQTINVCNDALRVREESALQLQVKLTALSVLAEMYHRLGRMVGRSYEESYQLMAKWLRVADWASRVEILRTLTQMVDGLGPASNSVHKDLYKALAKSYLVDRVTSVRAAAAACLAQMVRIPSSPVHALHDLESICTLCVKALDAGSDYEVRMQVAEVFAGLALHLETVKAPSPASISSPSSQPASAVATPGAVSTIASNASASSQSTPSSTSNKTSRDLLQFMAQTFIRGGLGGFLAMKSTGKALISVGSTSTPSASSSLSTRHKETRLGLAHAYVAVARELGMRWLERNLNYWLCHLLEIAVKCGPAVYSGGLDSPEMLLVRRCLLHVLRRTVGHMLSEAYQISACKQLGDMLSEYIACFVEQHQNGSEVPQERMFTVESYSSAMACLIALLEISSLVRQVGSSIQPIFTEASGILEPIFACLLHPIRAARVAAAWCLRCVTSAVPSQLTPLIDRCLSRLEHMKKSSDALSGFSLALAALLGGARHSDLGVPFSKTRQVFNVGEDLVRTATLSPNLAQQKTNAGWLLVCAVVSMGPAFVKVHRSRLVSLWKCTFPRSMDEANAEKQRGDAFTWEWTLEGRAGALASMYCAMRYCPELVPLGGEGEQLAGGENSRMLLLPIETTLVTMALVADLLLLQHGSRLRIPLYVTRHRLYSLLILMPASNLELLLNPLLREMVADITMTDNAQAHSVSSSLSPICSALDHSMLSGWLRNTHEAYLELEAHPHQTMAVGAVENDSLCLIISDGSGCEDDSLSNYNWPEPLAPSVASLDSAIALFGRLFPFVNTKRRLQLAQHFLTCTGVKPPTGRQMASRHLAIQLNILGALCAAMRSMGETRVNADLCRIDGDELQQACVNLIIPHLNSNHQLLKCLAIETLGRLAQAVAAPQFVAGNAQYCFDKLRQIRDERSRTGYALTLGSLHRYMGSLGSGQHLNTSVSIILALAQDNSSQLVQSCSILSLSLIATTGGGMFRGYVEPSLSLCLRLLLSTPATHVEVILAVAKLTSSLITSVGPELHTNVGTVEHTRTSFLIACSMMFEHGNAQIQAEAIYCLQQLHLFAPRFVQLNQLVTDICGILFSPHLVLRKAAVSCLRQLLQREAKEVRERAQQFVPQGMMGQSRRKTNHSSRHPLPPPPLLPETGLEGALFELLDTEADTDAESVRNIRESLLSLVQATCGESLNFWLTMCKEVIASGVSNSDSVHRSTMWIGAMGGECPSESNVEGKAAAKVASGGDEEGASDDEDTLQATSLDSSSGRERISPRWPTRVFGFEIVQRLMAACESERAHMDLALAKELQMSSSNGGQSDYLILHLSDLVRMGFMGATSENVRLRLAGLRCLQDVIIRFASVPEPEFPGHVLLEQFQAQVGAALRPAFAPETSSNITAAACQVCSTWIGSGVARDLNDLRRVHQLLVSSLAKLKHGSINTQLYNERAATLEKLAILKAWAEVYRVAVEAATKRPSDDSGDTCDTLLSLVQPELPSLSTHWLAVLRDSALLSLPPNLASSAAMDGTFFNWSSADACREYYRQSWPPILLASSLWLQHCEWEGVDERKKQFSLMLGMCIEAMSNGGCSDAIQTCLKTTDILMAEKWCRLELMHEPKQAVEVMNVLHRQLRLILTRDSLQLQRQCGELAAKVFKAAEVSAKTASTIHHDGIHYTGDESSFFTTQKSLVFALLEVCFCMLVRQLPQLNSSAQQRRGGGAPPTLHFRRFSRLSAESCEIVQAALKLLVDAPRLCSTEGTLVVLPTVLYLVLATLREAARLEAGTELAPEHPPGYVSTGATNAILSLRAVCSAPPPTSKDNDASRVQKEWESVLRSALLSLLNMSSGGRNTYSAGGVDEAVVMLAAVVMVTSAPPTMILSCPQLFHQLCRLVKTSMLESTHREVRLKALQSVNSLLSKRELRPRFAKELGPAVFTTLKPYLTGGTDDGGVSETRGELELPPLDSVDDTELLLIQEAVKAIELVLGSVNEEKEEEATHPPNVWKLHEFALRHLNTIGAEHPDSFKSILQTCLATRERIELAAQHQRRLQLQQREKLEGRKSISGGSQSTSKAPQQPSIKLAADFSAFIHSTTAAGDEDALHTKSKSDNNEREPKE